MKTVRFKLAPETFNRLLNAVQYLSDIGRKTEQEHLSALADEIMSDVMNSSSVLTGDIDPASGAVREVSFACTEATARSMFAVAEIAPDASRAGYGRDYAVLLYEQFRERHRLRMEKHAEEMKEIAAQWERTVAVLGDGDVDLVALQERFCKEHNCSEAKLAASIAFADAVARRNPVTINVAELLNGDAASDGEEGTVGEKRPDDGGGPVGVKEPAGAVKQVGGKESIDRKGLAGAARQEATGEARQEVTQPGARTGARTASQPQRPASTDDVAALDHEQRKVGA